MLFRSVFNKANNYSNQPMGASFNELKAQTNNSFKYSDDSLIIRLPKGFNGDKLKHLKEVLEKYKGDLPVNIEIYNQGKWQQLKTKTRISRNESLGKELVKVLI